MLILEKSIESTIFVFQYFEKFIGGKFLIFLIAFSKICLNFQNSLKFLAKIQGGYLEGRGVSRVKPAN